MRFWRREKGIDRILESWAQPSDEFVRRVVGGIESQPRRSYRLALTGALTVAALTLFGAFGGISYAAKAVQQAVNIVQAPTHTSRSAQPRTHSAQPRTHVQKSSSVKNSNARANTAAKHTGSSTSSTVGTSSTPGLSR